MPSKTKKPLRSARKSRPARSASKTAPARVAGKTDPPEPKGKSTQNGKPTAQWITDYRRGEATRKNNPSPKTAVESAVPILPKVAVAAWEFCA